MMVDAKNVMWIIVLNAIGTKADLCVINVYMDFMLILMVDVQGVIKWISMVDDA